MIRTAIRHTLSTLAALAVVTAFAVSSVSAQSSVQMYTQLMSELQSTGAGAPKTPKALATKKGPQAAPRFRANPKDIALPNNVAE